jgi:hypothetical protein
MSCRDINKQNYNNSFLNYTIPLVLLLTFSFVTSEDIKKTLAMPILKLDDTMKTNKINITNFTSEKETQWEIVNNNNGIVVGGSPFYEAKGKVIGKSISIFPDFNQTAEIILEKGSINGIGNVTNLESWITPYLSSTNMFGFGHGVITTTDKQMMSWIGYDTYLDNENNGTGIYQGNIFFNIGNSTGKLASFNDLKGFYITTANSGINGNEQTTKMWKMKQ